MSRPPSAFFRGAREMSPALSLLLLLPFAVFSVLAALRRFDPALEMAARSCGASRWRAFLHVTLPQILPGIASAALPPSSFPSMRRWSHTNSHGV